MTSRAAGALVAGALLVGLVVGRVSAGGGGGAEDLAPVPPGPGPRGVVAGVGMGWEHTERGVAAAALAYEAALDRAGLAPEAERKQVLDAITVPDRRAEIESAMEPGLRVVRERLGTDGILRGTVIGYRLRLYQGDEAEVELWGVGISSAPRVSPPQASWGTTTLRLRWVDDDWRLAQPPESRVGPIPLPRDVPSDTNQVLAALANLQEVTYVPR